MRRDGHVNVYDGTKFALIDTIDFGEDSDPDNLRYDAAAKKIYIGYGEGAIGVIDPVTDKRLPTDYKFEGTSRRVSARNEGTSHFRQRGRREEHSGHQPHQRKDGHLAVAQRALGKLSNGAR